MPSRPRILQTDTEKQLEGTVVHLEDALDALNIDPKEADEAFEFLKDHPNADAVTQEAISILADDRKRKKLLRKIDWAILPCMIVVYFLQFLDKTTIGYTAVMGLREDTHLKGQDYSNVAMIFYIGYLVAEFPTQYLAQHISRLGKYLGANVVLWGITLAAHSAAQSYAGLMICRTILGIFEACVTPTLVLVVAMWYKKQEQGRRISYVYVCNSFTSIFGGLVSYGISFSKNNNFASWRIFLLTIGLFTAVAGVVVFFYLPDSPVKARRFTDAEKVATLLRVKDNQSGTQNAKIKADQLRLVFKDPGVYLVGLSVLMLSVPTSIPNFASILLTTFGYTPQQALILNIPGGVVGAIATILIGYLSDRWNDRSLVMIISILPTIAAFAMMIGLDPGGVPKNKGALLFALYLCNSFTASFMLLLVWNASNLGGHTKKVTVNAMTLVLYCAGNIAGTESFISTEAPGYVSGKAAIMATLSVQVFLCLALRWRNDRLNKKNKEKLAAMSEDEKERLREQLAYADKTDRENPFFVYTH
ncbi:MFS transporter [Rhizodiscina lignyota]|uniref:MFS transporter n=1 Tax=Rhizodiscina lignyota TaxID=1504668 RepID=A0A9P4I8H1_9PEZI|nr:MFS transporter [Rhizodiscina lignyota]